MMIPYRKGFLQESMAGGPTKGKVLDFQKLDAMLREYYGVKIDSEY